MRTYRPFTPEDVSKLIKLREAGYRWNTIASKLNRTAQTCEKKYRAVRKERLNEQRV